MIIKKTRTVYFAPTRNRHFFTLKAAINAEAQSLIEARHPREICDYDECGIRQTYTSWHWRDLHRSDVLFRRICRVLKRAAVKS